MACYLNKLKEDVLAQNFSDHFEDPGRYKSRRQLKITENIIYVP